MMHALTMKQYKKMVGGNAKCRSLMGWDMLVTADRSVSRISRPVLVINMKKVIIMFFQFI